MRWHDHDDSAEAFEGEVAGALLAIDATLAGEPADPEYAEFAELALILRDQRPAPDPAFAQLLDERVERRFARPADLRGAGSRRSFRAPGTWLRAPRRWLGPGAAVVLGACAAVAVVIATGHGGTSNVQSFAGVGASAASSPASSSAAATAAASSSASVPSPLAPAAHGGTPASKRLGAVAAPKSPASGAALHGSHSYGRAVRSTNGASASSAASSTAAGAAGSPAPTPQPSSNRQIVQSAQLQLSAAPGRIDDVAQQVFNVIGSEDGIVDRSSVTATGTPAGGADFQLRVPSQNLADTLNLLSRMRGANVVSRTDSTQDITGQVGGAGHRLAEARALRRALLRQLAAATTTEQIDSLKIQLRDADAAISSDLSKLRGLKRQVAYSRISVSIQAVTPPAVHHSSGGFTIGRGAHDAKRVLVVVAGVALIALAVLVPVGLVAALLAWLGMALRRRRREQALDAAA